MSNRISSGDFGAGGQETCAVRLEFFGDLSESFINFIHTNIDKLGLRGDIKKNSPTHLIIDVEGPEVLVGALEMSCCLGPIDTVVEHWSCTSL